MEGAVKQIGAVGLAGFTGLILTLILTPLVRSLALEFGWVARPSESRWGKRVIARLGGVAMFLAFVGGALLWVPMGRSSLGLLLGMALAFGLGLCDDVRQMPAYAKLLVQLLIGCVVVISGLQIPLLEWKWISIPLSVLWFVLVMNAFNLLDNMDGLAVGIGAIAAGFCVLQGAWTNQWLVATYAAIVGGICLGFLRYNFPPAKIFMGDSGSHLLGFSLAGLALMGSWRHSTQLIGVLAVPTLVLAVPLFDTCFVTIQRLLHRQHPFVGGRDHVSHRLAILGLSTRQTVIALYAVSACLGLVGIMTASFKSLTTLAIWLSVVTALILLGRYLSQVNVYRLAYHPDQVGTPPLHLKRDTPTRLGGVLLHKRRLVEMLVDFSCLSSAYVFAHLLRFEGTLAGDLQELIVQSLPLILLTKLACFAGCGLYRGVWRYLSLPDMLTVFKAVTLGSLLSSVGLLFLWRFQGYSRAVLIIDWMLSFLAVGGSRVVERLLDEWIVRASGQQVPVIIIGASDTGARVLRSLRYEAGPTRRTAVGFLDDDPRKHGNRIYGVPVLGGRSKLAEILQGSRVREVLVAISDPPGELLEHVRQCCEPLGIGWRVVTAGIVSTV